MERYAQHQPTGFDRKGAFLPDNQDWIVLPLNRTRDSGILEESNFETALKILGGESETCEVHRFGHWGPGWYEIIIVHPSRQTEAEEIEGALSDYPVLDDEDYSYRQWNAAAEYWERMNLKDRMYVCDRFGVSIFAARRDELPQDDQGAILDYLTE